MRALLGMRFIDGAFIDGGANVRVVIIGPLLM
jgi:hypothetical protein